MTQVVYDVEYSTADDVYFVRDDPATTRSICAVADEHLYLGDLVHLTIGDDGAIHASRARITEGSHGVCTARSFDNSTITVEYNPQHTETWPPAILLAMRLDGCV